MIQIYTGKGKGKTTAALGLALRAVGNGLKVIMIQFMKGRECGEIKAAKILQNFKIEQYGRCEFVNPKDIKKCDYEWAEKGIKRAKEVIQSQKYDIVILDEINVALKYGIINLTDIIEIIKKRPAGIELILTGRDMPTELISYADLITEMREVKHYSKKGVSARKGIEY
jgi:cob(I)alamin adenosyltransferase